MINFRFGSVMRCGHQCRTPRSAARVTEETVIRQAEACATMNLICSDLSEKGMRVRAGCCLPGILANILMNSQITAYKR